MKRLCSLTILLTFAFFLCNVGSLSAQETSIETIAFKTKYHSDEKTDFENVPVITYNGKEISLEEYVNLPANKIGTEKGYAPPLSVRLFGEKGKNGVLCLYEKENFEPQFEFDATDGHNFVPTVFGRSEIPAEFQGGEVGLAFYILEHTKMPTALFKSDFSGAVTILCQIDENGKISQTDISKVEIIDPQRVEVYYTEKGFSSEILSKECISLITQVSESALDVVRNLPQFTPAVSFLHNVKCTKEIKVPFNKDLPYGNPSEISNMEYFKLFSQNK